MKRRYLPKTTEGKLLRLAEEAAEVSQACPCTSGDDNEWAARGCPQNEPCIACDLETVREYTESWTEGSAALDRITARLVELEAELGGLRSEHASLSQRFIQYLNELAQLKSAEPAREGAWVRCDERMPEPGDRVVVSYFYGLAIGLCTPNGFRDCDGVLRDVTHWAPLPTPPEGT